MPEPSRLDPLAGRSSRPETVCRSYPRRPGRRREVRQLRSDAPSGSREEDRAAASSAASSWSSARSRPPAKSEHPDSGRFHCLLGRDRHFAKLSLSLGPLLVRPGRGLVLQLLVVESGDPLAETLLKAFKDSYVFPDPLGTFAHGAESKGAGGLAGVEQGRPVGQSWASFTSR